MKEVLRDNLIRYNYQFKETESQIIIDLGAWQEVKVTFKDDKIKIEDKLRAWNILTSFPMSIKTALFLNPLFVIIFTTLILNFSDAYKYLGLLIAINILIVTFSIYYLTRLEGLKTKIVIWLNDNTANN